MQNVLLLYPVTPRSFWSFYDLMQVAGKKALLPPLGLLTVAALLPASWNPRFVDCNVRPITDADWDFAELVMISAMLVQHDHTLELVAEAKRRGKTIVAGGPYPTSMPEELLAAGCDYVVSGEAENAMVALLAAIENKAPRGVISAEQRPELAISPIPRFDLINIADYDAMPVQTSRGCPFECEFCDIISLFGRKQRYKEPDQTLTELEAIYQRGHRGMVFFSDDNFIGAPERARALLRKLVPWNKERGEPFWFITQASINLGQDHELIDLMTEANIGYVFIGIESPDTDVLSSMHKQQNLRHPLLDSIRTIQENGLTVIGSFILGFDNEKSGAGERIQSFVEAANIPLVMLNVLQALPKTALWDRLKQEGRLQEGAVGDMATGGMNFLPSRPALDIVTEHVAAYERLYERSCFMARTLRYIEAMRPTRASSHTEKTPAHPYPKKARPWHTGIIEELRQIRHLFGRLGLLSRHRMQFWRQLITVFRCNPSRAFRYFSLLGVADDIRSFVGIVRERSNRELQELAHAQTRHKQP